MDLLARLMRAEAEGDGQLGMLLVGNVGVNRVLADCLDFKISGLCNRWFFMPTGDCPAQWYNQWNTGSSSHIVFILHSK